MAEAFDLALLRRSLGAKRSQRSVKTLYGNRQWVDDLDIVNELGGHTGCVNALSWSKAGNLLASGSDDTYLNIWDFNPSNLARPFTLNTSVNTGHHANIFSVKFMPHSNDRTIITCAGDSQVRVFDLEYAGAPENAASDTTFTASTRSRRFSNFFGNARWLNEGNTNARIYRSHADRAKRVVTESSPHLFLTCSEDGEVRQWDLRQPSSSYPAPRGGGRFARYGVGADDDSSNVPPPLISYKNYGLDINSISCSGSQPQYIALGGAHLHCFLHDRRMTGRDLGTEQGQPAGASPRTGSIRDQSMNRATRCVKRFAPNGKRKMGPREHAHITACKISDANPNEMIASWSGDHIYSFDLVRSPDARDGELRAERKWAANRLKNRADHKRKRTKLTTTTSSSTLVDSVGPRQRVKRAPLSETSTGEAPCRVTSPLTESQKVSQRLSHAIVRLRKTIFEFESSSASATAMEMSNELTPHTTTLSNALGQCAALLPQMDEIMSGWSYPMDPTADDMALQLTLRRNRQASWRFVQASGCLSRSLGGRLQTLDPNSPQMNLFEHIQPANREGKMINRRETFCYDFLKAISLWLAGGRGALLRGFKRPPDQNRDSPRYPLEAADGDEVLIEKLRQYLLELADEDSPVVDLDANRFEHDVTRNVFESQRAAVMAFTRAIDDFDLIPASATVVADGAHGRPARQILNKGAAARFWGIKIGRSILMEAAEGVNFDFVFRAFGGLRTHVGSSGGQEEHDQEDIVPEAIQSTEMPGSREVEIEAVLEQLVDSHVALEDTISGQNSHSSENLAGASRSLTGPADEADDIRPNQEDEDEEAVSENENDSDISQDDDTSESDEEGQTPPVLRRRSYSTLATYRARVNSHVAYTTHTRSYRGHCNTKTVKDVNYYGLNDEYVVSGSDDGHFFIWDRKSGEVLNVLEGDGEVVNVVQGHPYEPLIAVSGIDSTVKIFGVGKGSRERHDAENGVNVANPGGGVHSSLRRGGRAARLARMRMMEDDDEDDENDDDRNEANKEKEAEHSVGLRSRQAMHRCYEIMSQNDVERRQDVGDAIIGGGMLLRFAAAVQSGQIQFGGAGTGAIPNLNIQPDGTIVVDQDNCNVM